MSGAQLYRLSGLALLVGMAFSVVAALAMAVLFPDTSSPEAATNPLSLLFGGLGVVGAVVALLGLPGMYLRHARAGGAAWLVGVALLAVTGMLFGVFFGLLGVLVFPVLASRAPDLFREGPPPSFIPVFVLGTAANVLGALLMAWAMLARRLYPRWCGYLMVLAAVLALVGFVTDPSSPPALQVLNALSPLPLFLVLAWAGYELSARPAPPEEQPSDAAAHSAHRTVRVSGGGAPV